VSGELSGLDRMWAGWRAAYVGGDKAKRSPQGEGTLFERILSSGLPDSETYVLWRGDHCAALLNAYPYGTGHVLLMPQRAATDLVDLERPVFDELWDGVRLALGAVRSAYDPDGVNVGANIGRAGGASVPDHVHVHVVPRWAADTTFLTSIAETRMLPEPLSETWSKLRDAWPSA
jgi:ATP adenylyltransferase